MTIYGSIGVHRGVHKVRSLYTPGILVSIVPDSSFVTKAPIIKSVKGISHSTLLWNRLITIPTTVLKYKSIPLFQKIATWGYGPSAFLDTSGSIKGVVRVEGALWQNVPVRLYYIPNGLFIAGTFTDAEGKFQFDFLEVGKPLYTVIAFQEGFNAVVLDAVSPVKTYIPPVIPDEEDDGPYVVPNGDSINFTKNISAYTPPEGYAINFI